VIVPASRTSSGTSHGTNKYKHVETTKALIVFLSMTCACSAASVSTGAITAGRVWIGFLSQLRRYKAFAIDLIGCDLALA
jgi:hypothetical protein